MDKEKINSSIQLAKERLMKKYSKGNASKFSVVLFTACISRHMNYNILRDTEVKEYYKELNEGIEITGMYSTGEFYPHFYEKSNEIYNVFHNVAITMLAL